MADTNIVVGVSTEGVQKAKTELNSIQAAGEKVVATTEKLDTANQKLNTSYKGTGGQIRNASYQLQDFFTQVQGGTSITTALSQQLPQLLSGFGLIGVVAGVGAAGIGLLINSFDLFVSASERVKRAADATKGAIDLLKSSSMGMGNDTIAATKNWVDAWVRGSTEVRANLEKNLKLTVELMQAELLLLQGREKENRAIRAGSGKRNIFGYIVSGQAEDKDRVKAAEELLRQKQLEADLANETNRLKNPTAPIPLTREEVKAIEELIKSYDRKILKINEEASTLQISNLEKSKAVALADLEIDRAKLGEKAYQRLRDATIQAVTAKNTSEETKKINEYSASQALANQIIADEGNKVLMTAREYAKMVEWKKENIRIEKETIGMTPQGKVAYRAVAEEALKTKQALEDANIAKSKTFGVGAIAELNKYKEGLRDLAKDASTIFGNAFKGIEDAMVNAFMGGKLSFKSMIDAMMADIARLVIRQTLMRPLVEGLSGSGSSGFGNLLAQGFGYLTGNAATALAYGTNIGSQQTAMLAAQNAGMGVPLATGTNKVPYDGFQATLHKGEAVVPAKYNPSAGGAGGSSITYSPVINIDSRTDQADVRRLVQNAMQQSQLELVDKINRGQVKVRQ